jgi:hypothetical protein
MELRPEFQIRTMIKAMTDVVLPAVDPENKLAREQAGLVVVMLRFLAERLPLAARYDRCELTRAVKLSARLGAHSRGGARTELAARQLREDAAAAGELLARAGADPAELESAVRVMRSAVAAFVQSVYEDGEKGCKLEVRRLVLEAAKEDLLHERAWVLPQGWELDPAAIPPIESLIR